MKFIAIILLICVFFISIIHAQGLPLYYWKHKNFTNFGDYISLKIVERIVGQPVREYQLTSNPIKEKKLLAVGSIISWAQENDIVWGSGIKRDTIPLFMYHFKHLDVRAVRGPLTRKFLQEHFDIHCPEIYGDPALLVPFLFPEFKRKENPRYEYLIIPHYSERDLFSKEKYDNVIYPTDPWDQVIDAILDSAFVISGSLHGVIIAESFGIPARGLREQITEREPLFKWEDYYLGTGRPHFHVAETVEEALSLGGEKPYVCDLEKIYRAFPFEYWSSVTLKPFHE